MQAASISKAEILIFPLILEDFLLVRRAFLSACFLFSDLFSFSYLILSVVFRVYSLPVAMDDPFFVVSGKYLLGYPLLHYAIKASGNQVLLEEF